MKNTATKPATDLERIQQSYTSGTQTYIPAKDKAEPTATRPDDQKASTHGHLGSIALRA